MPVIMSPIRTKAQPAPDLSADPGVRATAVIGLVAVGIIHALEIQGQLSGAVWLTAGFCLLAVAAPA